MKTSESHRFRILVKQLFDIGHQTDIQMKRIDYDYPNLQSIFQTNHIPKRILVKMKQAEIYYIDIRRFEGSYISMDKSKLKESYRISYRISLLTKQETIDLIDVHLKFKDFCKRVQDLFWLEPLNISIQKYIIDRL